jgi:hypothetical protein
MPAGPPPRRPSSLRMSAVRDVLQDMRRRVEEKVLTLLLERRARGYAPISEEEAQSIATRVGKIAIDELGDPINQAHGLGVESGWKAAGGELPEHDAITAVRPPPVGCCPLCLRPTVG